MARVSDGTNVPISPAPASSSNMGSPNGSLPDLEVVGGHPTSTMEEKFEIMLTKRLAQYEVHFAALASIPMLVQGFSRFENSILALTQSVASNSLLTVSVRPLFQVAVARQDLGTYLEIVMAPQPLGLLGPMAQDHLMTTGTQDADLILSQALMMNMRDVSFYFSSHVNSTTRELQF